MPDHPDAPARLTRPTPGGFESRAVPAQTIEAILNVAARAPSGTNTQPWNVLVVSGDTRARLVQWAAARAAELVVDASRREAFQQAFESHPQGRGWVAQPPGRGTDPDLADALARCVQAPEAALRDLRQYLYLGGAPVGLFILLHRQLGVGSVLDTGMFVQNIALAARARGLRAVVQTGWRGFGEDLRAVLDLPAEHGVLCAVALGWDVPAPGAVDEPVPRTRATVRWHL